MKKSLKTIALLLGLTFTLSFCLVACDDNGKKSGKSDKADTVPLMERVTDKYVGELADIYLLAKGEDERSQDYSASKLNTQQFLASYLTEEMTAAVNMVGSSVLSPAGCTDEYIMKLLQGVKDILIVEQDTLQKLTSVYSANAEAFEPLNELLGEIMGKASEIDKEDVQSPSIISTAFGEVDDLKAITGIVFDNYVGLSAEEKETVSTALQAFITEYNEFIDLIDATVIAGIFVNALNLKESEIEIFADLLGADKEEIKVIFESVNAQLTALGITTSAKKDAYVQFLSAIIAQGLRSAKSDKIQVQTILDVIDQAALLETTEGFEYLGAITGLIEKSSVLMQEVGRQIQSYAMTEKEIQTFVNASKTLNPNGLGYFVNRFVPCVEYYTDFVGYYLENADVSSLLAGGMNIYYSGLVDLTVDLATAIISQTISNILSAIFKTQVKNSYSGPSIEELSENLFELVTVGNQDIYNGVVIFCEDVSTVLKSYSKNAKFTASVDTALGSSFGTDLKAMINEFAGFYDEVTGENNKSLSDDRAQVLAGKYQDFIQYLAMSAFDFSGFENAKDSIIEYVQPISAIAAIFMAL